MPTFLTLALCGALGALLYAFPIMIAALKLVPPGRFAWTSMGFSVLVGGLMSPILVPLLGSRWPFLVQPEPYPLAVGIGLAINPLAPIAIKKLTGWADAYQIGNTK